MHERDRVKLLGIYRPPRFRYGATLHLSQDQYHEVSFIVGGGSSPIEPTRLQSSSGR